MSFLDPVSSKILAALDTTKSNELRIWQHNHSNLFDLRLHSLRTCPFLAYIPAYIQKRKDTGKWAKWLHEFYGYKHKEENNCKCDQLLEGLK